MKKLMIAAAAVMAAFAVNAAAAINWDAGYVEKDSKALGSESKMYVWYTANDSSAYDAIMTAWLAGEQTGEAMSKLVWDAYGASLATADDSSAFASGGAAVVQEASKNDYGYAITLITHEKNGDIDYYMGNVAMSEKVPSGGTDVFDLGLNIGGADSDYAETSTAWVAAAVPEPTSGLLLLLGVAGLALRRRRA